MKWSKVVEKFLKGIVIGGLASVISNPQQIMTGDIKIDAKISVLVGIISAIWNAIKHLRE